MFFPGKTLSLRLWQSVGSRLPCLTDCPNDCPKTPVKNRVLSWEERRSS
jgi:hypothetical protein